MAVNIPGLVGIIVFYLLILIVGIVAARKTGLRARNLSRQDVMMAGRNIGLFVGIFTMTATWVGGGYINGTSEILATPGSGLVWCQAPIGYSLSLFLGGLFFVERMRKSGFSTLLDPFHRKFGRLMGCLLYLPALSGEVFWSAAILNALGASLKVILDIDLKLSIIISAAIALLYTLLGGLYSVAYTDVVQLICMFVGLWLGIPFAMTNDAARSITENTEWVGELTTPYIGSFVDFYLLLLFGGIPWQREFLRAWSTESVSENTTTCPVVLMEFCETVVAASQRALRSARKLVYWQRALSARSVAVAKGLSVIGAFGCFIMAIPAVLFGIVAHNADWNQTDYGNSSLLSEDMGLSLPLVYFHMTPVAVAFIGLGAVSAAVMSSTDSSILSSSTMFACNVFAVIYQAVSGKQPSDTVVVWVMRGAQVVIAALACVMAITVSSIYYLFLLCSDFVYVMLFPQLLCVLYIPWSNSYGSLTGYVVGLLFRLLGGEPGLGLPAAIEYPWMDPDAGQQFPFRTLSRLISIVCILVVSLLTRFLFLRHILPPSLDVFRCFREEVATSSAERPGKGRGVDNLAYMPYNQSSSQAVQNTGL